MFWKKKPKNEEKNKIILGMVMLRNDSFNFENFRKDFEEHYSHKVEWPENADTTVAFEIDGELTAIGLMEIPILIW